MPYDAHRAVDAEGVRRFLQWGFQHDVFLAGLSVNPSILTGMRTTLILDGELLDYCLDGYINDVDPRGERPTV